MSSSHPSTSPVGTSHSPVIPSPVEDITWTLVGVTIADTPVIPIVAPFPFTVGRKSTCSQQLNVKTISGTHAELISDREQLIVADLGSTNGTFVNGRRISEPTVLEEEDLLQFADLPFRVRMERKFLTCQTMEEDVCDRALALVQFDRMMQNRLVTPNYQPIVRLSTGGYEGYEILARSKLFGLETSGAMFDAASRLSMEIELSRMLRWEGIRIGLGLPRDSTLFVNTHPLEIRADGLVESLAMVRQLSEDIPIILEVHEAAVTDPSDMRELKKRLKDLNIGLAYDDFGAGQTRLTELVEAPPDYLKFDISLIRGIDLATAERHKMIESLVRMTLDLGVRPLAEGVETPAEAQTCREMGFLYAQGFVFGHPAPIEHLT